MAAKHVYKQNGIQHLLTKTCQLYKLVIVKHHNLFLYIALILFLGTKVYDKIRELLMKTALLNDIKRLRPDAETSCLEGFHSTLNPWHPKMMCFSWLGTFCRYDLTV